MPYTSIDDLPPSVRSHLPVHAQEIYRGAFNSAWQSYEGALDEREERAHRIAWAAVKRRYHKDGDHWIEN